MRISITIGIFFLFLVHNNAQCYVLVWSDEFDGTEVDGTKWTYQNGTWNGGGGNVENCFVPANSTVSNGSLHIESKYEPNTPCFAETRDFTSGFVQTKNRFDWTYGKFEARIKMPPVDVLWPAFWMMPQDDVYGEWPLSGEIDISEVKGNDMTRTYGNAHWGNSRSDRQQDKQTYTFPPGNGADKWHVYGLEWREGQLDFFIDGEFYGRIDDFDEPNAAVHPAPFDQGFYLRLNVFVGGDYLGEPWNNAYNGLDQLPGVMEVDWVRVYQETGECEEETVCDNIISNGNFDNGTQDWYLFTLGNAAADLSVDATGNAVIDIEDAGTTNWHLSLRQNNISLTSGQEYIVRVEAFADQPRSAPIIITNNSGGQYAFISQTLTTTSTVYEHQFTMAQPTDDNAVFSLALGTDNNSVYVHSISISAAEFGTDCDDDDPCTTQDIVNADCNCEGVYTDEDQDGYCITEDPDDTNPCVPDLCPSTCESVSNWNFEDGLADWSLFTFADAAGNLSTTANGEVLIDVSSTSSSSWHLALRQNDILLEQGKSYIVRLEAYADADRPGAIILSQKNGSQYIYINQPLTTLPTVYEHHFDMSASSDMEAVLHLVLAQSTVDVKVRSFSISEISCLPNSDCAESITHSLPKDEDNIFQAKKFIRSSSELSANLEYRAANSIHLLEGFEVLNNQTFIATIDSCP